MDGRITRAEYNSGFNIIDGDKDGKITKEEFGNVSHAIFDKIDLDGDGFLTREEWEAGFDMFDLDHDGYITRDELHSVAGPPVVY
jgi:Ca2+-binding EF-hand superfamily protein